MDEERTLGGVHGWINQGFNADIYVIDEGYAVMYWAVPAVATFERREKGYLRSDNRELLPALCREKQP